MRGPAHVSWFTFPRHRAPLVALLAVSWAASLLGVPVAAAAPPPVHALFGCPLADGGTGPQGAERWRPPPGWRRIQSEDGGWSVAAPPSWRVTKRPRGLWIESPRGRVRLEASLARPGLSAVAVRAALERVRLGPSFAAPPCEARLSTLLAAATGAKAPLVASYGRPLGGRRRSVAAFFTTRRGVLAVTVTARWGRREPGAPWPLLRQLLGGVRPGLTAPAPAPDHESPTVRGGARR